MLRKLIAGLLVFLFITSVVGLTDLVQTIPSEGTATANGASAGCATLEVYPGSFVPSVPTSLLATCGNNRPALILGGTEIPTFTLAVGYDQVAIVLHNTSDRSPCGFDFPLVGGPNVPSGRNITSSGSIVFSSSPNATLGQMLTGGYDYCLHVFSTIPVTSFTVTWTP